MAVLGRGMRADPKSLLGVLRTMLRMQCTVHLHFALHVQASAEKDLSLKLSVEDLDYSPSFSAGEIVN